MNSILQGLLIIAKYDPKSYFAAEHDQIWCGDSSLPLTPEDKEMMAKLHWRIDKEAGGWTHYC